MNVLKIILWVLLGIISIFILYLLLIMVSSLFISKKKYYDKDSKYYRWLLNSITGITLAFGGIKVDVIGKEKLPKNTKFLLVSNHRSKFDPIITWYVFRKTPIAFLSKIENFKVPWFGRIIRKCCFRDIDRNNPINAYKTLMKSGDLMKNNIVNFGIYPEGTRNRNGNILPFHNGIFKAAQRGEVPVVVVTIRGTEQIAHKKVFGLVYVTIEIHEVLSKEYVMEHTSNEIGEHVREVFIEKTIEDANMNLEKETKHE